MIIRLIAIGTKMPSWVNEGFNEYAKRLTSACPFELIEIQAEKRTKNSDLNRIMQTEGEKILSIIKPNHRVIALEVTGNAWSTKQLAQNLKSWQLDGRAIDLLIGGPEGLSPSCLQKAELKWSLSPLTLPHPLVRIVVTEQLYRAQSILLGHPYHR